MKRISPWRPPWWLFLAAAIAGLAVGFCFGAEPILTIHRGVVDGLPNVRDFGADGSDTEDDSAAIQAAIDADRGPVYIPPGHYRVGSTLEVRQSGVTLFGFAEPKGLRPAVRIEYTGKTGSLLSLPATDPKMCGFATRGIVFTGPGEDTPTDCFSVETSDFYRTNFLFDGISIQNFGRAIVVKPVGKGRAIGRVTVRGCNLHWNDQAVVCENTARIANLVVTQSEVRQHKAVGGPVFDLHGRRITIEDCVLEGQPRVVSVRDSYGVVVQRCYFEGNSEYWLSATRVQGIRFVDNYLRQLGSETYTEPVVLRECMDIVVERPTVNKGGWEIP